MARKWWGIELGQTAKVDAILNQMLVEDGEFASLEEAEAEMEELNRLASLPRDETEDGTEDHQVADFQRDMDALFDEFGTVEQMAHEMAYGDWCFPLDRQGKETRRGCGGH